MNRLRERLPHYRRMLRDIVIPNEKDREFVVLCGRLNLFTQALVVIDGAKFKAVNNRDKNFTPAKLKWGCLYEEG